jgi:hypothetical protein
MCLGIDLSMRSTGLFYKNGDVTKYKLVVPPKDYCDEELLVYVCTQISLFIQETNPEKINLEGLSFGSVSSSKDLIAGNFWSVRKMLYTDYPRIEVEIIPVLSWRSPLFNKEERANLKLTVSLVKKLKEVMADLPKDEKKAMALENESLIRSADIKHLTWCKLPEVLRAEFEAIGFKKGCYDLTDAYFICNHTITK